MDSYEEEVVVGTPVNGSPASSGRSSPVEYSSGHNSPVAVSSVVGSPLTKSKVLELKKDELKIRLESLGHEAKGTKVQLQQQLQAVLSPERAKAKVQSEQFELDRQWQKEDREFQLAKLKLEADERKELKKMEMELEAKRLEAKADEKRSVNNTAVTKQRLDIEAKQLLLEQKKLELELKKLEIGASSGVKLEKASDRGMFRVSSALKLIPKFDN